MLLFSSRCKTSSVDSNLVADVLAVNEKSLLLLRVFYITGELKEIMKSGAKWIITYLLGVYKYDVYPIKIYPG